MTHRTTIFSVAIAAATIGMTLPALAQGPANPEPAAVKSGTYVIEPRHTRIIFSVSHMGFTTWYGDFSGAEGHLVLDPKALSQAQLDLTIPVGSVSTTNGTLDAELKSPAWFDAAKYPTITFHSTKVVKTGPRTAEVIGDLTFHGVTHPVQLQAQFNAAGINPLNKAYTAGFEVTGTIKRSDFAVKTYVPLIGDDVTLMISAAFEKPPA